jgi:hypothetical protein
MAAFPVLLWENYSVVNSVIILYSELNFLQFPD